jgi:hypothetical protein
LPISVVKLIGEKPDWANVTDLLKGGHQAAGANNPEHIETPESIDRHQALSGGSLW